MNARTTHSPLQASTIETTLLALGLARIGKLHYNFSKEKNAKASRRKNVKIVKSQNLECNRTRTAYLSA